MNPQFYSNLNKEPTEQMRALQRERTINTAIQIVLFLALIGTSVGFGFYADQNRKARTCPLIYDKANSAVTEAHMKAWATDANWPITTPTWSDEFGSCICDRDPDPLLSGRLAKTPVWIAPCDLKSLRPEMEHKWPADFVEIINDGGGCLPTDHVKVCLSQRDLVRLWTGDLNYTNGVKHCHSEGPTQRVFTAWDGDLYCTADQCASGFQWFQEGFCMKTGHSCTDPCPTEFCATGYKVTYYESGDKAEVVCQCPRKSAQGSNVPGEWYITCPNSCSGYGDTCTCQGTCIADSEA